MYSWDFNFINLLFEIIKVGFEVFNNWIKKRDVFNLVLMLFEVFIYYK